MDKIVHSTSLSRHAFSWDIFLLLNIIFFILLTCLFSSCSSRVSRPDGPPNFYVDESKIPNAKPKPEPLAKYGNNSSYWVFGKRYHVMKSFKNYDETGTASWYGTKFHARRTSSGERYNMLAMTAAHKSLPLPTYVEVTNLANRRKVIVKVNDRGPFLSNRVIDLSYVAAKKLGMIGRGTARVRIKAINPYTFGKPKYLAKNKYKNASTPSILQGHHARQNKLVYLQVGAFRDKTNALKLKERLTTLLATPVKISRPSAKGKLYRVQVGPIKDAMTAEKLTNYLKVLNIK